MTVRLGRSLVGTATSAGHLDGHVDGTNRRTCDPRGRWITWHPGRAESDWTAYRDAYLTAYTAASKSARSAP